MVIQVRKGEDAIFSYENFYFGRVLVIYSDSSLLSGDSLEKIYEAINNAVIHKDTIDDMDKFYMPSKTLDMVIGWLSSLNREEKLFSSMDLGYVDTIIV